MVIQGGSDHARYRAFSVPVGPEVAVDRESCGVERPEAVRGGVGRAAAMMHGFERMRRFQ